MPSSNSAAHPSLQVFSALRRRFSISLLSDVLDLYRNIQCVGRYCHERLLPALQRLCVSINAIAKLKHFVWFLG